MLLVLFAPPAGAPSRKNGTLQYVFGPLVHPLRSRVAETGTLAATAPSV